MPLLKRKPFPLVEPPEDLKPGELVYQVRFTKEILSNYHDYLNRMNLYRQRLWTCKMTGKGNLTYEEAMVSENSATEKIKEFPKELMKPVLRMIQFNMLPLRDLSLMITAKLKKENNSSGIIVVDEEDLITTKPPFTQGLLKSFIRESTYRSIPWVLHEKLALKYGISTDPPNELKGKVSYVDRLIVYNKKRKKVEQVKETELRKCKRMTLGNKEVSSAVNEKKPIEYPIDDLLVQPGEDDPAFTERPSLLRNFSVPMDCVGDLLMVWDFLSSFRKLLRLWPFSLEDFEYAICHKDHNLVLIIEFHTALFRLLLRDESEYFSATQEKKRTLKMTLVNWTDYLCDFIEMIDISELRTCLTTIRRGHYKLLDTSTKLQILCQLVGHATATNIFKEILNEYVKEQKKLNATRREEAIEEAKLKREDKEHEDWLSIETVENNLHKSSNGSHSRQNGVVKDKRIAVVSFPIENGKHLKTSSKKLSKKNKLDIIVAAENGGDGGIIATTNRNKDQREEYFEKEMEKRVIRTSPLGEDINYNRYWWFKGDGRLFVENLESNQWGYYDTKEELDALTGSLNCKGVREKGLHKQLKKCYTKLSSEMQKRSKEEMDNEISGEETAVRRSNRVRARPKGGSPAKSFRTYENKWKEN